MQKISLRQQTIIKMIGRQEYCSIDELAQYFNVTAQTTRRDINQLCAIGLACRHHGGVGLPVTLANRSYVSRKVTNQTEKQQIKLSVVQEIPNGCTLFLGMIAGIAEKLVNHSELRVVSNNVEAAHLLSQYDNIETWIPGGRIRSNDRDVVGDSIGSFYGQFTADIGIISCASINLIEKPVALNTLAVKSEGEMQEYAFEYELREAIVSQAIISGSRQKWLVANSAKRQQKANTKVAPLGHFDRVFGGMTDKNVQSL
jgi:DeoR family glycerol-3-phosphate regulon repressor